jgi:hypothetical protein
VDKTVMSLAAPPYRAHLDILDDVAYRLVSVESAEAPEGCAGLDWFVYRISRGVDGITGYRRGDRESVRADAETIVVALNERREWKKSKLTPKERRRTAAAARAVAAEQTDQQPSAAAVPEPKEMQ